jgi:hypothetical protein
MRNASLAVLLISLIPSMGCQKKLPLSPSDWSSGIIIYEHANYLGESAFVEKDIANLDDYKGPCFTTSTNSSTNTSDTHYFWKNCISSIRVAAGWKATLYVDTNFRGKSVEISADVSNLQLLPGDCDHDGFNDCIESIKVARQ